MCFTDAMSAGVYTIQNLAVPLETAHSLRNEVWGSYGGEDLIVGLLGCDIM
jgi:hypothetical protein